MDTELDLSTHTTFFTGLFQRASRRGHTAMLEHLSKWTRRAHFPKGSVTRLGFGSEYWDHDPLHYEGHEQLRKRMEAVGRKFSRRDLAYHLSTHLLDDVIVAAGGVEYAIKRLRECRVTLSNIVYARSIKPKTGLSHEAAIKAWYAFSEVLSWSRTVVERLERLPVNKKKFSKQGLIPALKPKRLKKKCEVLLEKLKNGRVGQARPLGNFVLHSALVRNPFSGVEVDSAGSIVLSIPDAPVGGIHNWYSFTWDDERDGFAFAEELWQEIQSLIDDLLYAFEKSIPKRLRRP